MEESTAVYRDNLSASYLPTRKKRARRRCYFLPHHHRLFNYPSSHYWGSVTMHHVPEGSPLTNILFISIGLCKVRIIRTSATGFHGRSKRNYLLWSHGKFEMAKMHLVRSRLKAPETLEEKKWVHRESGRIAETEKPAEIRVLFLVFCLV